MEVVKMIEEIRMEQSPLGEDYDESRNTLSPSLATTEDVTSLAYTRFFVRFCKLASPIAGVKM